jgi:small ligand-binding sensory domain FIST
VARFAAALSEHPLATQAIGEIVGDVLEQLDDAPDTVVLFVSEAHAGALEDLSGAVQRILTPTVRIGTSTGSTLAGSQEVERVPSVAIWAGLTGDPIGVRVSEPSDLADVLGSDAQSIGGTLVLLGSSSFDIGSEDFRRLGTARPDLTIAGAIASPGSRNQPNRVMLNGEVFADGAVGVVLPAECPLVVKVSHGAEEVGDPFTVTRCERNMIIELAGRPAADRLREVVVGLEAEQCVRMMSGLFLGSVPDNHVHEAMSSDFVIHEIRGEDRTNGALAIDGEVALGATVQFQIRDAISADEQLQSALLGTVGSSALVFVGAERGMRLFEGPDHDAEAISTMLGTRCIAGMFGTAEFAPVGGVNTVHRRSVVSVIFGDRPPLRFRS